MLVLRVFRLARGLDAAAVRYGFIVIFTVFLRIR